ncbi:hypothetical protein CLU79DRAFT_739292 [Phycomyces nitens]|nr:hypothetical protein CLU79DRAFT_739292 [Phycomyces nitens]
MHSLLSNISSIFCLLVIMLTFSHATVIRMTHNFDDPMLPNYYRIEFNANESLAIGSKMVKYLHTEFTFAVLNLHSIPEDEDFHGSLLQVRNLTSSARQDLIESVEKQPYVKAVYPGLHLV